MTHLIEYLVAAGAAVLGALEVTPVEAAAPTPEQLGNIAYQGIFQHTITLTNGHWVGEPFVTGGSSRPAVGLIDDFILTGDLNADGKDEAVVLAVTGMRGDQALFAGLGADR